MAIAGFDRVAPVRPYCPEVAKPTAVSQFLEPLRKQHRRQARRPHGALAAPPRRVAKHRTATGSQAGGTRDAEKASAGKHRPSWPQQSRPNAAFSTASGARSTTPVAGNARASVEWRGWETRRTRHPLAGRAASKAHFQVGDTPSWFFLHNRRRLDTPRCWGRVRTASAARYQVDDPPTWSAGMLWGMGSRSIGGTRSRRRHADLIIDNQGERRRRCRDRIPRRPYAVLVGSICGAKMLVGLQTLALLTVIPVRIAEWAHEQTERPTSGVGRQRGLPESATGMAAAVGGVVSDIGT